MGTYHNLGADFTSCYNEGEIKMAIEELVKKGYNVDKIPGNSRFVWVEKVLENGKKQKVVIAYYMSKKLEEDDIWSEEYDEREKIEIIRAPNIDETGEKVTAEIYRNNGRDYVEIETDDWREKI